jgi:hypothetical protein
MGDQNEISQRETRERHARPRSGPCLAGQGPGRRRSCPERRRRAPSRPKNWVSRVERFVNRAGEAALDTKTPSTVRGIATMARIVGGAQPPVNAEGWVLHDVSYPSSCPSRRS